MSGNGTSKLISFRLQDFEVEALQLQQSPEDKGSLALTAKRLLMSVLGVPASDNRSANSVDIQDFVKREVESAIADVKRELDERLGELAA
ncbi:hypothetical protein H6G32_07470 [Cylindrospermum sp. FACHB-282]|nr:hypothetical protein [Cylindrospermum sp. FACHB-282]